MNEFEIDKAYVSPYDKFLAKFDREHALTPSQIKEINANARIAALRDGKEVSSQTDTIWEAF